MDYVFVIKGIIMQVVLFLAVPFIVWIVRKRKELSFLRYVGLVKPQIDGGVKSILLVSLAYIVIYGLVHFTPIANLTQPSASTYAGLGFTAIIPGLLVCFIQQAFAEEVLFRGFIGKRLTARLGLLWGNILQALIFGLVHVLLSISGDKNIVSYLIILVSISAGGWLLGYIAEKLFKGSILPGILLHGLGNFLMILSVAF